MDMKNKIALITGGANGIGFSYAKEFLRNGASHVAVLDLADSKGEEAVKKLNEEFGSGRAIFVVCDVTKSEELEAAFARIVKEFGRLDIVINNAGIMDDSRWELEVNINYIGLVRGTLLGFQYMGKDKGGKGGTIVNIASIAGLIHAPMFPIYVGTKCAVIGLTRSFGHSYHYDKTGVRLLAMCPSATDTQLVTGAPKRTLDVVTPDAVTEILNTYPSQTADSVAQGMVQIIRDGKSGSVWLVENGEPAFEVDIPDEVIRKVL
ncbi:15-hydroxyprostaglandin dehydrogenase [NAD(+)]-like [Neodiprion virginianus]|uniref:15-hydroxyprostaglandin dehydrogenase [NAD(+)]-like n=1 Tax=Neodiprion virginianus TaxID=2961670 RepID=UPI001EE71981|nr:15-hydroxyprostaglandin dehydrogenase [NAD(+)]-like [Neodiprion virginianus]